MEIIKTTRANNVGVIIGKDTLTWDVNVYVWVGEWYDEDKDIMNILKWWNKYPIEYWKNFFNS